MIYVKAAARGLGAYTPLTNFPMNAIMYSAVMLLALAGAGASEAQKAIVPIETPSRTEVLSTLRKEHPRLLVSKESLEKLKRDVQSDAVLKEWHQKLEGQGRKILGEAASKYEIPDGLRLLSVSRRVLGRIQTLALLYHTTGEKQFVERAWKELEAAANFQDWNPRHFLDTAEMAHAFAIGYDWLYSEWSTEQKEVIRTAMVEKALKLALGVYKGTNKYGSWHKARHNWNQVCNGGVGIAALAIADEEPELASEFLEGALKSIQLPMAEFEPDGAWAEGPGYWNYATIYNVAFLAALESALGTEFKLSSIPGFNYAGHFPIYLTGPLGRTFNYADGGDGTIRAAQMFWLAKKFREPAYASYEMEVASAHPLDLVWYQDVQGEKELPLDRYFREAEVVTFRSDWKSREAWFVGFKAGDNKANHSNLDLGTFVLDAQGVRWGLDLGADNYNMPGYFGSKRWSYYRMRAEGHNTLVINPGAEPDQDPKAATKMTKFKTGAQSRLAVADLTPAYAKQAKKVQRGIRFGENGTLVVQDEIETLGPSDVWWFFHTQAAVELSGDKKEAVLVQDGKKLVVQLRSPANGEFQVLAAGPLPGLPNPEEQNKNSGVRKLAIKLEGAKEAKIAVVFAEEREVGEKLRAEGSLANW